MIRLRYILIVLLFLTFSTISTPFYEAGDHPVSGHRQFGLVLDPESNEWIFFARGLDRVTDNWIPFADDNEVVLGGGHDLWTCLMSNVSIFFGGTVQEPIVHRPNWVEVKNKILSLDPAEILNCITSPSP